MKIHSDILDNDTLDILEFALDLTLFTSGEDDDQVEFPHIIEWSILFLEQIELRSTRQIPRVRCNFPMSVNLDQVEGQNTSMGMRFDDIPRWVATMHPDGPDKGVMSVIHRTLKLDKRGRRKLDFKRIHFDDQSVEEVFGDLLDQFDKCGLL